LLEAHFKIDTTSHFYYAGAYGAKAFVEVCGRGCVRYEGVLKGFFRGTDAGELTMLGKFLGGQELRGFLEGIF